MRRDSEGRGGLTWVTVDLSVLASNLAALRRRVGGRKVMAAVKADAYGHGLEAVGLRLEREGVDYLAVAFVAEGVRLRRAGVRVPILVLTALEDEAEAIRHGLTVTVYSEGVVRRLARAARLLRRRVRVHLDVDTGMGRIGVMPDRAVAVAKRILVSEGLDLEGLYTHFSASDDPKDPYTERQLALFRRVLAEWSGAGLPRPLVHAANSGAILNFPGAWFDMVRPGIALYGYGPNGEDVPGLRPVLSWRTEVFYVKRVVRRTGIGYGHTYRAAPGRVIATIPVGYADGYDRLLSNRGKVLVRGRSAPVVGRVSMDQTTVDVTGIPGVGEGTEVTLIGRSGGSRVTAGDLARLCGTIPYEILCGIGSRVRREYVG